MSRPTPRTRHARGAPARITARIALRALLVATAAWLLVAPAARAANPQEYRQAVVEALAILDDAADADEAGQATALDAAGTILARAESVDTAAGRSLTPKNPPLRERLAARNLHAAQADLTALLDALDASLAASAPPPDARRQLADILARPEFRPPEVGPLERMLGTVLEPLRLAWERFWRTLAARLRGAGGDGGQNVLWLLLGALVVAGLIALVGGALTGSVVSGARTAEARRGLRDGPAASRARAFELAARGEYRTAVHELHLAMLLALNARGVLRYRSHLTNREHLVDAQMQPTLRRTLLPAVDVYDRLWYSGATIGAEDWERFVTLADAVEAAAPPRGDGWGQVSASLQSEAR